MSAKDEKKLIVVLAVILIVRGLVLAKPVAVEQVRRAANTCLKAEEKRQSAQREGLSNKSLAVQAVEPNITPEYTLGQTKEILGDSGTVLAYVTELEPEGFIITSADDTIRPVLGYSFEGTFPFEDSKDNVLLHLVQWDVQARKEAMKLNIEETKITSQSNNELWESYTSSDERLLETLEFADQWGPLITTNWYQRGHFDDFCPLDPSTGQRSAVGCTATAMAQILNYWKYPDHIAFDDSDRYESNGDNGSFWIPDTWKTLDYPTFAVLNSELSTISYSSDPTEEGYLCFATGIKLHMNYSSVGSGAWRSKAYVDDFEYGSARSSWDWNSDTKDAVITNMKSGWPAQMWIGRSGKDGGHSVVLDGYQTNDFFHVNMGWSGTEEDTWYNLPAVGDYDTIVCTIYNICSSSAWNQYGADERNTFRTLYPVPDVQPQRKWRCSNPGGSRHSFSEALVVGASGRIYAVTNPMDQGQTQHPSIQIISREGTPEKSISFSNSDDSIYTLVQNKRGDVYFGLANGTYNTRDKTIIYRIASGTATPVSIFEHSSPDPGWLDEHMKVDQSNNIYFIVNPLYSANGSKIYSLSRDGTKRWERYLGVKQNAYGTTPAIDEARGQVYLLYGDGSVTGAKDNYLIAINNTNGTINFTYKFPDKTYYDFTDPTIGADGTIYVGQCTKVYAFTTTLTPKWIKDFDQGLVVNLALASENVLYSNIGKMVSGVRHPGYIRAINTSDGSIKWELEPVALGEKDHQGTMYAGINGTAMFSYTYDSTGEQYLAAIRDFGSYGKLLWNTAAGSGAVAEGGEIAFGPGNTIYTVSFGENNSIYALSIGDREDPDGLAMDYLDNNPPNASSNPIPSNKSVNQPANITLSWSCSDPDGNPLKYDLLICALSQGEEAIFFPVGTKLTSNSFQLNGLLPGVKYLWKLVATDGQAVTEGPTWVFATQPPPPPSKATSPSPSNGATNQLTNVDLSWANGGGAMNYDIYFGTDSTPDSGEYKGNQASTSYDPGTLAYSTTYYWCIDANNTSGITPGDVWSFTTAPPPQVAVPNVLGMTQSAAETSISGAGLIVGTITQQYSNTIAVGLVISQNPVGGTAVNIGSAVNIVVSKGSETVLTVLTYDDFETGWGNYKDGGTDCGLHTGTRAHQGSKAANIQDNNGTSSSFYHSKAIDVHTPGYIQIEVDFWFYAYGMEKGEDFFVEYYDGLAWRKVATYVSGKDFTNGKFYHKTVNIDEARYEFPTNMRIRFRCDASSDNDDIYIDEVRVSGRPDITPPEPDPATWHSLPHATSGTSISMTASTASDPSGVEYYFDCISGDGHDSGWQDSSVYKDKNLAQNTQYSYQVTTRDKSDKKNETTASTVESATTWASLTYDDFENGWGNYTDGGSDCGLHTGTRAHQGSRAAHVQDNSGSASSFYHTQAIDIHTPGYTQIIVDFWFYTYSMETGEDFFVEYYDGSAWRKVATYVSGKDFANGKFYHKTVNVNEAKYKFPTNMRIRFRCDASDDGDDVYLDEVRVSAY